MSNVIKAIFGKENSQNFEVFSENLTIEDCMSRPHGVCLDSLHLMAKRYRGIGRDLDPTGQKAMAIGRLYKMLMASGEETIGMSVDFGVEMLADLEKAKQLGEE